MNKEVEILAWDTELLGYSVAQLRPASTAASCVEALIAQARCQNIKLLYWFVEPTDAQAAATAQAVGARLVDHKVTYTQAVVEPPADLAEEIEVAHAVTPQLRALALQSGHYSRFQTDPGFATNVYEQLYTRWIENSVAGTIARQVLVYRSKATGREVGLLTLDTENDCTTIGLLAVDETARRQAVGAQLIMAARARAFSWRSSKLRVVTQQYNTVACQFYERCGFQPELIQHVYHVWL